MSVTYAWIGVDPGGSGAGSMLCDQGEAMPTLKFKDATERDIALWMIEIAQGWDRTVAVIERVSSSPQMGVTSSFSFGRSYGFLRGCLSALGIPFAEVTPQKWQKDMGCLTKGDKNVSKQRAQQLYPHVKITHANADSLLIATYCKRNHDDLF